MEQSFYLNYSTKIITEVEMEAVNHSIDILKRDITTVFYETKESGGQIRLTLKDMDDECYWVSVHEDEIVIQASDALGFIYGLIYISYEYLGIHPFWYWNDQEIEKVNGITIHCKDYSSKKNYVRYRGWFINDEVLIHTWNAGKTKETPWEMAFEALLRCGGNMVIPGTDKNSKIYAPIASKMGLWITHHHAEPLGAEMFARAYPEKNPSYAEHPELFHQLWEEAIERQKDQKIVWNLGFRGQGDCPFWETDPQYDTDKARGELISKLIHMQYDLLQEKMKHPICCTNLYGEVMELYQKGYLQLPKDVIYIWADNGYGKMVSRRQGNHNPRIRALPEKNASQGLHGAYYHASFYDLQAANHITMFPNSLEFIKKELKEVFLYGNEYLIINCSNIKPHVFYLQAISELWNTGNLDVNAFKINYVADYFKLSQNLVLTNEIADLFSEYANATIAFGKEEDEHAGDQFTNYTTREFITQWMRGDTTTTVKQLLWATGSLDFKQQMNWYKDKCEKGCKSFEGLFHRCVALCKRLEGGTKQLFMDSIFLQVKIQLYCIKGALSFCEAFNKFIGKNYMLAFYEIGIAKECYEYAVYAMTMAEHDKWAGFYANDCLTDVKFTAYLLGSLMRYLRVVGDGPHFFRWQREYLYKDEDKRVVLITNMENHLTDDELYQGMKTKLNNEEYNFT